MRWTKFSIKTLNKHYIKLKLNGENMKNEKEGYYCEEVY